MIPEFAIRELLIASCHADVSAELKIVEKLASIDFVALLVKIALDEDEQQGDAPMQAAYFLSHASPSLTEMHEDKLLSLFTSANGYQGHIALTLGRMQSLPARFVIESALSDEDRFDKWLYERAIECYESEST